MTKTVCVNICVYVWVCVPARNTVIIKITPTGRAFDNRRYSTIEQKNLIEK